VKIRREKYSSNSRYSTSELSTQKFFFLESVRNYNLIRNQTSLPRIYLKQLYVCEPCGYMKRKNMDS